MLNFLCLVFANSLVIGTIIAMLRINADNVNGFILSLRERLDRSALKSLSWSGQQVATGLRAVYGNECGLWWLWSTVFGLVWALFVATILILNWGRIFSHEFLDTKDQLEVSVDPWLARVDDSDRREAMARFRASPGSPNLPMWVNEGDEYAKIREHVFEFDKKLSQAISEHPQRQRLSLAVLFYGTHVNRGPSITSILGALVFNILIDALSVASVFAALAFLPARPSVRQVLLCTLMIVVVSAVAFVVARAGYSISFNGMPHFWKALLVFGGLSALLIYWGFSMDEGLAAFFGILVIIAVALGAGWGYFGLGTRVAFNWGTDESPLLVRVLPTVLAASAVFPAILCATLLTTWALLSFASEPVRHVIIGAFDWLVKYSRTTPIAAVVLIASSLLQLFIEFVKAVTSS